MPIQRNSFIQMSKLTNLKGRISYISSHARQENLYAVYETTERKFWTKLAECNQEEFSKSGTEGKCIEAREFIIALPESFVDYQPDMMLKLFTEHFRQNYGVECIAALHHNKRKTNYHIHLIFSERKLLDEPIEKIASRNMFYDEAGKHVRTKKEICDESGQIRKGCRIIKKGEVYERKLFTVKDKKFKSEAFLDEVKHSYTDLINIYVKNDKEKLKVFERSGVYLPMKKIGKNNPKAAKIEADNKQRQLWNITVDRALISGITEQQILEVKKSKISEMIKEDIEKNGNQPQNFYMLLVTTVKELERLIIQMYQSKEKAEAEKNNTEQEKIEIKSITTNQSKVTEQPKKTPLVVKYPKLAEIYEKLDKQNHKIYQCKQQLDELQEELDNIKGLFKGRKRKELREKIEQLQAKIDNIKQNLSNIVQNYGYRTVKDFMVEYKTAKTEYNDYKSKLSKWQNQDKSKKKPESIKEKLRFYKIMSKEQNKQQYCIKDKITR